MVMVVVVLVDIVIVYISSLGFGNMGQMRTGAKKKKVFLILNLPANYYSRRRCCCRIDETSQPTNRSHY